VRHNLAGRPTGAQMLETDYTGRSSATNSDVLAAERRRPPAPLDENQRRWRLIAKQPANGPKKADLTRLWIVIHEAGVTVRWETEHRAINERVLLQDTGECGKRRPSKTRPAQTRILHLRNQLLLRESQHHQEVQIRHSDWEQQNQGEEGEKVYLYFYFYIYKEVWDIYYESVRVCVAKILWRRFNISEQLIVPGVVSYMKILPNYI
jgi:hypothetical protein